MSIYTNLHDKYGAHRKVAEFRLFLLNDCFKSCENCFYRRSGNKVENYDKAYELAVELRDQGYRLETCYLLPTDFFENEENYQTVRDPKVAKVLGMFEYIGVASTMEGELDFREFRKLADSWSIKQIEAQVNLINEKLFHDAYFNEVKRNIEKLRDELGEKVVFNLALNLGREITEREFERTKAFVEELSDDGIIEINFTFLYNGNLAHKLKSAKLLESLKSMKKLGSMYNREEERYNERTLLRKPAFIFMDHKAYLSPIIPFDEYAFAQGEDYELPDISFSGFLETITNIEKHNAPIWDECHSCEMLSTCMGKAYFAVAREYDLPCFLGV